MNSAAHLVYFLLLLGGPAQAQTPATAELDLKDRFQGFEGCFVLFDVEANTYRRHNSKRCAQRFAPCSTFKIPNSLIGLETGVVTDEKHVFKWDGQQRWNKEWNRDHDLRSALRESVVWYYQEIARRVGAERMREFVRKFNYGNLETSGDVTLFWLNDTLQISADEQVAFLDRLRRGDLPVSRRSLDIMRDILILSQKDGYVLRAKTGTQARDDQMIFGWFVGYVRCHNRDYVFALNISGAGASGMKAKAITLAILESLGIKP